MTPPITVTMYVDPACPWAWLTSRWLLEVEKVRPVQARFRLFDLAEVNRGKEADERMREAHQVAERALRVLVQARRERGEAALSALYTALGETYHERGTRLDAVEVLEGCAHDAGLDPGIVDRALGDPSTLDELLTEHNEVCDLGGFGVPTLVFDGARAFFGPVVDDRLSPEDAGELWDHVAWLLRQPHFFELKRERTARANIGRYRLEAARAAR